VAKKQAAPRGDLKEKRERFEEAGKFPVGKLISVSVIVLGLAFGGFAAYQYFVVPQAVGGATVDSGVTYPAGRVPMVPFDGAQQTAEGLSFPVQTLKDSLIVGLSYERSQPMPAGYQAATGGNGLPLLSYISPKGNLVVATSFCEPCRGDTFHIDGNALVCDVCFTRWDLDTLEGLSGGCMAYPPEEVAAELIADTVFIPNADLEAWTPRAF